MGFGPLTIREWRALARLVTASGGRTERRALKRLMTHHGVGDAAGDGFAETATTEEDDAVLTADPMIDVDEFGPAPQDADWWDDAPVAPEAEGPEAEGLEAEGLGGAPLFDPLGADGSGVRWDLVGPVAALHRAAEAVGLDRNAVQSGAYDDDEPEGAITHPSVFCPDPVRFLAALAVMTKATPQARLFRVRADADGTETATMRVFPEPGDDVMADLDRFLPAVAGQVQELGQAVGDALEALGRAMDEAGGDLDFRDEDGAPGSG